jgi:hypothetical protein
MKDYSAITNKFLSAAEIGDYEQMKELVLQAGNDKQALEAMISAENYEGLNIAAENGSKAIVDLLLNIAIKIGLNINNIIANNEYYIFSKAVLNAHFDIAKKLYDLLKPNKREEALSFDDYFVFWKAARETRPDVFIWLCKLAPPKIIADMLVSSNYLVFKMALCNEELMERGEKDNYTRAGQKEVIKILIALCDEKTFASALNEISKSGKVSPEIKEWLGTYHEPGSQLLEEVEEMRILLAKGITKEFETLSASSELSLGLDSAVFSQTEVLPAPLSALSTCPNGGVVTTHMPVEPTIKTSVSPSKAAALTSIQEILTGKKVDSASMDIG